jgi:hypothetical protein
VGIFSATALSAALVATAIPNKPATLKLVTKYPIDFIAKPSSSFINWCVKQEENPFGFSLPDEGIMVQGKVKIPQTGCKDYGSFVQEKAQLLRCA